MKLLTIGQENIEETIWLFVGMDILLENAGIKTFRFSIKYKKLL